MRDQLISIATFLAICLLFIVTGLILIMITDKIQLHLSWNQFVGGSWDDFFKFITHLGDGIAAVILIVIGALFCKNKIASLSFGLSVFLLSGLITQLLKRLVFSDVLRPTGVFGEHQLKLVEGVDMHTAFSFPSGHSTAAFATFAVLCFFFRTQKKLQLVFGLIAILTAFSRVYLSQHFTEDIVVGGFIAILVFLLLLVGFSKFEFGRKALED